MEPVLVEETVSGYLLLAGRRRYNALKHIGRNIAAVVLSREDGKPFSEAERGLIFLQSNATRSLDRSMHLAALRYLQLFLSPAQLEAHVAPLLGLVPKSREWKLLNGWFTLPQSFDPHLEAGRVPLEISQPLSRLSPTDMQAVEPLFRTLRWSRSAAVELATLLLQTAAVQETSVSELAGQLTPVLEKQLSPNDAMRTILDRARAMRRPVLTDLEGRFDRTARELAGGGPWRVSQPDHFETPAVELSTRIATRADLDKALAHLQRMAENSAWETLWTLAEDGPE